MSEADDRDLIGLLTLFLASGKVDTVHAMPALQELTGAQFDNPSVADLIDAINGHDGLAFQKLASHLHSCRMREAHDYHVQRKLETVSLDKFSLMLGDLPLDAPPGWRTNKRFLDFISSHVLLAQDRRYISSKQDIAPIAAAHIQDAYSRALVEGLTLPNAWQFDLPLRLTSMLAQRVADSDPELASSLHTLAHNIEESCSAPRETIDSESSNAVVSLSELAARYKRATELPEKKRLLDQMCCSSDIAVAEILDDLIQERWEQERVSLILTCRFGKPPVDGWQGWKNWFARCRGLQEQELQKLERILRQSPAELFLFWCAHQQDIDRTIADRLERWCVEHAAQIDAEQFVERWAENIPTPEWNALTGNVIEAAERNDEVVSKVSVSTLVSQPVVIQSATPKRKAETRPVEPTGPSLWNDHIQPFIAEQWYILAGVVMVIAGASLLAFYTWDKHWLVRYTMMPALLGAFTAALAWMASWIERQDKQFIGTAAILRGAAIGLLPINFMAVALLSSDDQVSGKPLVVPLMGAVYLLVFGYGLKNWCHAVHRPLEWLLGGTLLLLNSLVMLGPLAMTLANVTDTALLNVIGIGFYLGFLLTAFTVFRFTRQIMTRELAEQQRVPWFFGAALAVTFLQVFAWVHGYLQHLPQASTYAPMVILAGGLVLLIERSALLLRRQEERHGEESFVGFALILLGVLMGATEPHLRIVCFAIAGAVWTFQAITRRNAVHDWIALTLFMLAGTSVGMLDVFPKAWLPALGISIAVVMAAGSHVAKRFGQTRLSHSCIGMHVSVLMLTTVVAVLAQWRYLTPPLYTGGCLLLIAVLFAFRAWRDNHLKWVHTAMTIVALSLLYLGCVDMNGRTLHGNTMVFGLSAVSILWLILNACTPHPLVRQSRSTVLWVYGALAVTGMLLRVVAERGTPGDVLWYWQCMDLSGPLLMAVVLTLTTWYSRSLIPIGMAAVIVIILFPELKANMQQAFPALGWGTGLGSSLSAFGLMLLCFPLKTARFLKDPGEGDRFMGSIPFPVRRYDHTLFTLPILASVLFLTIKTDTWTLARQWLSDGEVVLKTSIAIIVTSVTWTLLAVWYREQRWAPLSTVLGCLWLFAGIEGFTRNMVDLPHWTWPVLATGITLQILWLIYVLVPQPQEWVERILVRPTRQVLEVFSLVVAVVWLAHVIAGREIEPLTPLLGFLAAQFLWHGLTSKNKVYGSMLFLLTWVGLLSYTAPGTGILVERLSMRDSLTPTLWLLCGIQAVYMLLEFKQKLYQHVRPLTLPFLSAASGIAIVVLLLAIGDAFHNFNMSSSQRILLIVAAILTARAHTCVVITLPILLLAYIQVCHDALQHLTEGRLSVAAVRLEYLCEPVRLATFSFILMMFGYAGRWLYREQPIAVSGAFGFQWLRSAHVLWLFAPAAALSLLATGLHTAIPSLREDPQQLWAPYLAAATLAFAGSSWWRLSCHRVAVLLLTIGNISSVRIFFGESLRDRGISEIQLVCLGAAATLLQGTIIRYLLRRQPVTTFVNQVSLTLAGLILSLLAANYFVHPNLAEIPWQRFVVSGSMAYLAGLYFRRAARRPDVGDEAYVNLCEGLYHFGVTLATWCALLIVPAFRTPAVALCTLGVPIAYFYSRAEIGLRAGLQSAGGYRNSAAVLSFFVLGGYVFRAGFQMVLFPNEPVVQTDYYHYNAPFIMLLSMVMLRLHGLGGTTWLAFYGGLALMTGTYFSLTWLPGFSPFKHPMSAAWAAVALSHFWTLVSHQRSPLRTAIQRLAAIDGQQWFDLRRSWGVCLLVATQAAVLFGLLDWKSNTYMVAPLLVGAASILIHLGAIRRSPVYFTIAGVQMFIALHADFLVDSYLTKDYVVWAVLGAWTGILLVHQFVSRRVEISGLGVTAAGFAIIAMLHVMYHHPCSAVGLWVVAVGALLAALTPCPAGAADSGERRVVAGLMLAVPAWLMYFSQASLLTDGMNGAFASWPLLCTTAVVFLTGSLSAVFQVRWLDDYDRLDRSRPRLFDQTLLLVGSQGRAINTSTLFLSFVVTVVAQVMHYGRPFTTGELVLMMALYAAYTGGWFFEGRLRRSMTAYVLLQLSVVGFFAVARRQLMLTTEFWTPEYDVWASLAVSFGLTGFKQVVDLQQRETRIPLMGTLFALPVVALTWVLYNHMGSNVALLVVGLHSLMFTFMGKDDKESPYNVVALAGFVAFVLMAFWSKLELRVIHAYTLPVGVGILILLQMFRQHIEPGARNRIRLMTLLIMIGSAAYYALSDDRYPLVYNMTLIIVCLVAMALGSFFRIRLYLALGFAGLMVDVGSIVFKVMRGMERSSRMTAIGSIVLLVGVGLVFGAIYYKTHRDHINGQLNRLRAKAGEWE